MLGSCHGYSHDLWHANMPNVRIANRDFAIVMACRCMTASQRIS